MNPAFCPYAPHKARWVWLRARFTRFVEKRGGGAHHTVGVDLTKSVFQLHRVDAGGYAVLSE